MTKLQSVLVLVLAVILGGGVVFGVMQFQRSQQKNTVLGAQQEVATLINQVGKLMILPTNETPTIATVSDISKLKGQPFFSSAQNGDKVLIYTQAKEAILYRPSLNKIIKVAPVNIQNTPTSAAVTSVVTSTPIPTKAIKAKIFYQPLTLTPAVSSAPTTAVPTTATPTIQP